VDNCGDTGAGAGRQAVSSLPTQAEALPVHRRRRGPRGALLQPRDWRLELVRRAPSPSVRQAIEV